MNVGQRIKERRKKLNISAADLAEYVKVSESTIFRYEKGDIEKMPTSVLEKIAEKLRTSPGVLMGWENEKDLTRNNEHSEIVETIAAHIDDDATEEEIEEILAYIEMRKSLRRNKKK